MNFYQKYKELFNVVCRLLGDGWRINLLDNCENRIKLTSPMYKTYSVFVRQEKGRISISGSVDSRYYRGSYHSCTVATNREASAIANTIKNKIICDAQEQIQLAQDAKNSYQKKINDKQILKDLISRLVNIQSRNGSLCGFIHEGLNCAVDERYSGKYRLDIDNLDKDKLIKVVGFLSTL